MEVLHVDNNELLRQHKKEILDKGEYVVSEIVVGVDDRLPYIELKAENSTIMEIAWLTKILEQQAKELRDNFPDINVIIPILGLKKGDSGKKDN